ncbi:hypothetical protein H5410_050495 [Solanum commersonii]|uniref:Uncharacterized protein n=1 Tax=Solanum commersonii TaxID=4109 RepID=A0A9J5WXR7_SOLCO|nr:hypothetical protein H5410_050495 [Solanum commersonii]
MGHSRRSSPGSPLFTVKWLSAPPFFNSQAQEIDYEVEESYNRGYHSCKTTLGSRVVIRAGRREEEAITTGRDEGPVAFFISLALSPSSAFRLGSALGARSRHFEMSTERAERRVVSVPVCHLVKEGLTSTRLRVVILVDITQTPLPRLMTLAQSLNRCCHSRGLHQPFSEIEKEEKFIQERKELLIRFWKKLPTETPLREAELRLKALREEQNSLAREMTLKHRGNGSECNSTGGIIRGAQG